MTAEPRRRPSGGRERSALGNGSGDPESSARRERLIDAFTKVASERGYAKTTVADVAGVAGVPCGAFYDHFGDKRQCLGAAQDAFIERLIRETAGSIDARREWPVRVREAVLAALHFVDETTSRARFFAVEILVAGPSVVGRQVSALDRVVPLLREGRLHYPNAADLPAVTEAVLIGGAAYLLYGSLLAEEPLRLGRLGPELVEILLTPYIGREEARRIAS